MKNILKSILLTCIFTTTCYATNLLNIDNIRKQLHSVDKETRRAVMDDFIYNKPEKYGEEAIDLIMTTCVHDDEYVRIMSFNALVMMGGGRNSEIQNNQSRLKPLIASGIVDTNSEVSQIAAEAYASIYGTDSIIEEIMLK